MNAMAMERPWWFVRRRLLATLLVLATILTLLLIYPEAIERGLHLTGL
jgi:hypothetical protein